MLLLSLVIAIICGVAAWVQMHHPFANDSIWLLIAVFGLLSFAGVVAALFGDDWWVALVLGEL